MYAIGTQLRDPINHEVALMYVCTVITYSKSKDQPGKKVANPARGQLNKENEYLKKNQTTPRPSEHPPVIPVPVRA